MTAGASEEVSHGQEEPITKEGIMDRVWLYLGGMVVAFVIAIYTVISIVKSTSPPAY